MEEPILVRGPDQPLEDIVLPQIIYPLDSSISLRIRHGRYVPISPRIRSVNGKLFRVGQSIPVRMADVTMERRMYRVQNVTKRNGGWGSCKCWAFVVPQLKVDGPLWDSIVRYPHPSDRRVRSGMVQFLRGDHGKLARSDVSHGSKDGRCKVEVKS